MATIGGPDNEETSSHVFHPDLNFEDGNIILSVTGSLEGIKGFDRRTPGVETVLLKLHRSVLKAQSSIFEDMLTLPLTPTSDDDGPDVIEGLPVVRLPDDPSGIVRLAKLLYHLEVIPGDSLMQKTFDFIAPVLGLLDKYDIPRFYKPLSARLQEAWPITLEAWDELQRRVQALADRLDDQRARELDPPYVNDIVVEPAAVIRLGMKYPHIAAVLPAAFYQLSCLNPLINEDDDMERFDNYIYGGGRLARWDLLEAPDLMKLHVGKAAIAEWVVEMSSFHRMPKIKRPKCSSSGHSEGWSFAGWWEAQVKPVMCLVLVEGVSGTADVLEYWKRLLEEDRDFPKSACVHCREAVRLYLERVRQEFWDTLPGFFGLQAFGDGDLDMEDD